VKKRPNQYKKDPVPVMKACTNYLGKDSRRENKGAEGHHIAYPFMPAHIFISILRGPSPSKPVDGTEFITI